MVEALSDSLGMANNTQAERYENVTRGTHALESGATESPHAARQSRHLYTLWLIAN
jgi:hypothetical protein